MVILSDERQQRFWQKIDRAGGPDACWEWQGYRHPDGYGQVKISAINPKRPLYAHRVAYELMTGQEIPDRYAVLHKCDNPPCCNPRHHRLGTQAENVRDRFLKGRCAKGERNGKWKHVS